MKHESLNKSISFTKKTNHPRVDHHARNVSVYDTYLSHGGGMRVFLILNSKKENIHSRTIETNDVERFTVNVPNTNVTVTKELPKLSTNIQKTDPTKFIETFDTIAQLAEWSEETQITIIQLCMDTHICRSLGTAKSIDEIKKKIFKYFYPEIDKHIMVQNAQNVKQENFTMIDDYYMPFCKSVTIIGHVTNMTKREQNNKVDKLFYQNLTLDTKESLIKLNHIKTSDILSYINSVEKFIIMNTQKGEEKIKVDVQTPQVKKFEAKYCSYYKSNTHNTRDCYALKRKDENTIKDDQKDKPKRISIIQEHININSQRLRFILMNVN